MNPTIEQAFIDDAALMLRARGVAKTFTLHPQGGMRLEALDNVGLDVRRGDCVVLSGPSGVGKSTFLRCLYGNYLASAGSIAIRGADQAPVELAGATPHAVMALRHSTLGYVSQFLRVIPRVPTLTLVAEPLTQRGVPAAQAEARAAVLLARLNLPRRLWSLPPATFSGGEQQRVNIARGLIAAHPVLLLDEPTASLDAENRDLVAELVVEARQSGAAIIGIFHDALTREKVATHCRELTAPATSRAGAAALG
jgi:alpha-D-ribose 1-methylphosphonate 5-triphosphate synthase subunit PhnL